MPPKASEATLARQARFVFRGKVQRLKAANVAAVEDKRRTVIVRVEQVEKAPEAMTGYAGQEITVKLAPAEKVRPGEQARFYTNGWLYGETIAVESLGHVAATPRTAITATREPAVNLETSNIEDRVANADVVVQGRVTSVRLPQENRTATRVADARRPITEHDPEWREAVVEVAGVEKGTLKKKQIVVRFPSSQDVLVQGTEVPAGSRRHVYAPTGEPAEGAWPSACSRGNGAGHRRRCRRVHRPSSGGFPAAGTGSGDPWARQNGC
jgi:hypothetical protein